MQVFTNEQIHFCDRKLFLTASGVEFGKKNISAFPLAVHTVRN
jgi:hypothetical protein